MNHYFFFSIIREACFGTAIECEIRTNVLFYSIDGNMKTRSSFGSNVT